MLAHSSCVRVLNELQWASRTRPTRQNHGLKRALELAIKQLPVDRPGASDHDAVGFSRLNHAGRPALDFPP